MVFVLFSRRLKYLVELLTTAAVNGSSCSVRSFLGRVLPARKGARGMRGATLAGHVLFAVLSAVLSPEFSPPPPASGPRGSA